MVWLAAQMWILLIAAFALGVAIGWWIWSARKAGFSAGAASSPAELNGSLGVDYSKREPMLYSAPRNGPKDDLTQLIGIDGGCERQLNDIGVFYLHQIAEWGPARTRWIEDKLAEPGRVEREHWVEQARGMQA